jgi:threonine synthase
MNDDITVCSFVCIVSIVSDAENSLLNILVHYPLGQISAFQRKQLTTIDSPRVKVATFEGGGDDMDAPIKRMLTSSSSTDETEGDNNIDTHLCGVNSYNIGRPLVQMVHFIWTYLRVMEDKGIEPSRDNSK